MGEKKEIQPFKETKRGAGGNRDTVPVTGKRGQEERDSSAIRVAKLHNSKQA